MVHKVHEQSQVHHVGHRSHLEVCYGSHVLWVSLDPIGGRDESIELHCRCSEDELINVECDGVHPAPGQNLNDTSQILEVVFVIEEDIPQDFDALRE